MDPITLMAILGFGGSLLGAGGSMLSASAQNKGAQQAAQMSEQAKAWTQLLGLNELDKGQPEFLKALQAYQKTTGMLPGAAKKGTKQQLQQVQGAETSGLAQIMKNQQAAMGGVGQNAASRGFYGSSIQGTQNNQVRANTNQSIGDLMAQFSGQRAGIIGQGTQNLMQGLLAKAQGQMAAGQGQYGMTQDKMNWLLQTANQYNIRPEAVTQAMGQRPEYMGMSGPGGGILGLPYGAAGGGGGGNAWYDPTGIYGKAGNFLKGLF